MFLAEWTDKLGKDETFPCENGARGIRGNAGTDGTFPNSQATKVSPACNLSTPDRLRRPGYLISPKKLPGKQLGYREANQGAHYQESNFLNVLASFLATTLRALMRTNKIYTRRTYAEV
jgi:hypothetical protein